MSLVASSSDVLPRLSVSAVRAPGGDIGPAAFAAILDAMAVAGGLVLEEILPRSLVGEIRAGYDEAFGQLLPQDLEARTTTMRVGPLRYEVVPRLSGRLARILTICEDSLLTALLDVLLGKNVRLSSVTIISSFPGAPKQRYHRDTPHLFPGHRASIELPPFALSVAVPLVDVDERTGPTIVWPGSHVWERSQIDEADVGAPATMLAGDCLLLDYRTMHMGLANRSETVRPLLQLVFTRAWYFDEHNHKRRHPIDIAEEEYQALSQNLQQLLWRVARRYTLQTASRP